MPQCRLAHVARGRNQARSRQEVQSFCDSSVNWCAALMSHSDHPELLLGGWVIDMPFVTSPGQKALRPSGPFGSCLRCLRYMAVS